MECIERCDKFGNARSVVNTVDHETSVSIRSLVARYLRYYPMIPAPALGRFSLRPSVLRICVIGRHTHCIYKYTIKHPYRTERDEDVIRAGEYHPR